MAARKRRSAETSLAKLHRADELTAGSTIGEEAAAKLEVSAASLYN
ncbi:hypothetical protein [Mycobacterium sp. MS1601]|nr:hypothetical protein [Mycobacterium sp. MS1601]